MFNNQNKKDRERFEWDDEMLSVIRDEIFSHNITIIPRKKSIYITCDNKGVENIVTYLCRTHTCDELVWVITSLMFVSKNKHPINKNGDFIGYMNLINDNTSDIPRIHLYIYDENISDLIEKTYLESKLFKEEIRLTFHYDHDFICEMDSHQMIGNKKEHRIPITEFSMECEI